MRLTAFQSRIDCDLPDGWTLNRILLHILEYVSNRLSEQEGYRYRLCSCIVHTRTEASYLGWWPDDGRLAFCRDLDVGRYGEFSVPDQLRRTLLIDLPKVLDLASITVPLVGAYSVYADFLAGRSAGFQLLPDGILREWPRWLS